MPVNWNDIETWQRLVASIVATGVKARLLQVDLKAVALNFGTTYDTVENKLRAIRKDAELLKKEVENGPRRQVTPPRARPAPATPRQQKSVAKDRIHSVGGSRVTKTPTPRKQRIKVETGDDAKTSAISHDEESDADADHFIKDLGADGHMAGTYGVDDWQFS